MMKVRIEERETHGKWEDQWVVHPCRAQKFHPAMEFDPFPAKLPTWTRIFCSIDSREI